MPECNSFICWIWSFQTLIAGLSAVVVGGGTVYFIRKQIAQTSSQIEEERRRAEDRRVRQLRALRAGLPIALSEIHQYSKACIDILLRFLNEDGQLNGDTEYDVELEQEMLAGLPPLPEYPATAFQALQIVIEHADVDDAKCLHEIISYGQIHASRFQSFSSRLITGEPSSKIIITTDLYAAIRDSVGLQLHVERAFDYAREISEHIHELANAEHAADALLWGTMIGDPVRQYILEHWPPNFPQQSTRRVD